MGGSYPFRSRRLPDCHVFREAGAATRRAPAELPSIRAIGIFDDVVRLGAFERIVALIPSFAPAVEALEFVLAVIWLALFSFWCMGHVQEPPERAT